MKLLRLTRVTETVEVVVPDAESAPEGREEWSVYLDRLHTRRGGVTAPQRVTLEGWVTGQRRRMLGGGGK